MCHRRGGHRAVGEPVDVDMQHGEVDQLAAHHKLQRGVLREHEGISAQRVRRDIALADEPPLSAARLARHLHVHVQPRVDGQRRDAPRQHLQDQQLLQQDLLRGARAVRHVRELAHFRRVYLFHFRRNE